MLRTAFVIIITFSPFLCLSQKTIEKKGVRLYEHHSSSINQGKPFGIGADGSKSGYDFVQHKYYNSFNPINNAAWSSVELLNIDMVEHMGPFGGTVPSETRQFGFTSATSTIWNGDIKGNNLTVYAEAPPTFAYDSANDVSYIKKAFPTNTSKSVNVVSVNKVYLAKIRNTELYVAMKITSVKNGTSTVKISIDTGSVYFDFDYKYGVYVQGTNTETITNELTTFSIVPNPSNNSFEILDLPRNINISNSVLHISDLTGKTVYFKPIMSKTINHNLQSGYYTITISDGFNTFKKVLIVANF